MTHPWWYDMPFPNQEGEQAAELRAWTENSEPLSQRGVYVSTLFEFDGVWSYLFRTAQGVCWFVHTIDFGDPDSPAGSQDDVVELAAQLAPDRWAALEAGELPFRAALESALSRWLIVKSQRIWVRPVEMAELPEHCLPEPDVTARPR